MFLTREKTKKELQRLDNEAAELKRKIDTISASGAVERLKKRWTTGPNGLIERFREVEKRREALKETLRDRRRKKPAA